MAMAAPFGMRVLKSSALTDQERSKLLLRPEIDLKKTFDIVRPMLQSVKARGDVALQEYTAKFDGVKLDLREMVVDVSSMPYPDLSKEKLAAFDTAYANIRAFHLAQRKPSQSTLTMPGVECRRVMRPIPRVGIYVPGGTAVLPSTALMLGVPAQIAGCKCIVLATPPKKDGSVCPEVVYCAKKCGVNFILKAGGAQAVAALAYGTATCPKVDKICGPGNQFVTAAKMLLSTEGSAMVAIDMPAGPSEQLCIADKTSRAASVVADLLSQAEHGKDSQVVGVFVGLEYRLGEYFSEFRRQVAALPRAEIIRAALSKSFILLCESREEAVAFSNAYAPEHLCIQTDDAEDYVDLVENAGSIFLGHFTPESAGDYASGTNHALPTYGYARMYSGVSLDTFCKYITMQNLTEEGLLNLGPHVEVMAACEGLDAHKNAVTIRLNAIRSRL